MKYSTFIIFLFFTISFSNAQTNMIIRTADGKVKIHPINSVDSVYFQEITGCGTVTDYDGNIYETIIINNKCWLKNNLAVTHYSDGSAIQNITDNTAWANLGDNNTDKAYCWYNNDINNKDIYGALYTYAAAVNGNNSGTNVQGVCPIGWHVPNNNEWEELVAYLGSDPGSKLAGNASLWANGALEASPFFGTTGFNAFPAGERYYNNGEFINLGHISEWWSSTDSNNPDDTWAFIRFIFANSTDAEWNGLYKSNAFSIRCIKD